MKKLIVPFLTALLLLAALCACGQNADPGNEPHEHAWQEGAKKEATCTEEGSIEWTCVFCGEKKTEAVPMIDHVFGEEEVTKDATCTEEGEITRTCTVCGAVQTETTPMIPHEYEEKITKAANCAEEGEKQKVCVVCGDTISESIPKTDQHDYQDTVTKNATCAKEGIKTRTCKVCGDTQTEAIPKTGQHNYKESVTKKATCKAEGVKTRTCKVCGDTQTETIPKTKHNYIRYSTSEATCGTPGGVTYACTICYDTYFEQKTPALGHVLASGSKTCDRCGGIVFNNGKKSIVVECDDYRINNVQIPYDAESVGYSVSQIIVDENMDSNRAVTVKMLVTADEYGIDLNGCFIAYSLRSKDGTEFKRDTKFYITKKVFQPMETDWVTFSIPIQALYSSSETEFYLSFYSPW